MRRAPLAACQPLRGGHPSCLGVSSCIVPELGGQTVDCRQHFIPKTKKLDRSRSYSGHPIAHDPDASTCPTGRQGHPEGGEG